MVFLPWCPVGVFGVLFCLCFSFIMLPCSPEKLSEKLSSCQVRVLEEIFGSEVLVFCLGVRLVFFRPVLPMFLFNCVALFSRKLPENFLLVRYAFWKELSGTSFWFFALVSGWCFLVLFLPMFQLYHVALFSRKLPEKLSSCQVRVLEEILGSELLVFLPWCPVGVFWSCFAYVFALLCCLDEAAAKCTVSRR